MSRNHRSRRRGLAVAVLVAALGVVGGVLFSSGPVGAAPREVSGVLPAHPEVVIDPAKGRKDGDPCFAEAEVRKAAEDLLDAAQRKYDQDLRLARLGTETLDVLNATHRNLIEARMVLIDARYAEATCHLRLAKGGKCKEMALEYNRIADLIAQQEAIVRLHVNDLGRALGVAGTPQRRILDLKEALAAARVKLGKLAGELAKQEQRIKDDPACKNFEYKRPAPVKKEAPKKEAPKMEAPKMEPPKIEPRNDNPPTAPTTDRPAPYATSTNSTDPGDVYLDPADPANPDYDPASLDDPYFDPASLDDFDLGSINIEVADLNSAVAPG